MKVLHEAGMGGGGALTPHLTFHLRGEHVNADVAAEAEHSSSSQDGWRLNQAPNQFHNTFWLFMGREGV